MRKSRKNCRLSLAILSLLLMSVLIIGAVPLNAVALNEINELGELEQSSALQANEGELFGEALENAVLSADDIPEGISAEQITEKAHVNRLREQEKDLKTVIFQNKSGSKTAYYYNKPVKYLDENGEIKDKSTDISAAIKKLSRQYAYTALENDVKSYFPHRAGNGVKMSFGEYEISFYPLSTNVSTALTGQKTETLSGAESDLRERVIYDGVFGESTRLQYTPCLEGLKEDIVLLEYTGKNIFRFVYNTDGLMLTEQNGTLVIVDPTTDKKVGSFGKIISYDANGKSSLGTLSVAEVRANEEYVVTVTVDEAFLSDSTTAYPVYVDPTVRVWLYDTDTETSCLRELVMYQPSDVSVANSSGFTYLGNDFSEDGSKIRLLYSFDPSYISSSLVSTLKDAQIGAAYVYIYSHANDDQSVSVYPYIQNWPTDTDGDGFVYANNTYFEGYDEDYYDSFTVSDGYSGYYGYEFTSAIKYWQEEGTNSAWSSGFIIKNDNETLGSEGDHLQIFLDRHTFNGNVYFTIDYSERELHNNLIMTYNDAYDYLNNSSGNPVLYNPSSNVSTHKWKIEYYKDGKYLIRCESGSKALTATSTGLGLESVILTRNLSDAHLWEIYDTSSGYTYFKNVSTGTYLIHNNGTLSLSSSTTGTRYLWNMYRPIAATGSPVAYEPEKWNYMGADSDTDAWKHSIQYNTNCYAYMLNNQDIPYTYIPPAGANVEWFYNTFMQPGQSVIDTNIDGIPFEGLQQRDLTAEPTNLLQYVGYDAENYGFTFESIGRDETCPIGSYKVALVIDIGKDYHWYRQNPDGTWSHKSGRLPVTDRDDSGNIIYDPYYMNRGGYTSFIGYYCVTPMNNMLLSD